MVFEISTFEQAVFRKIINMCRDLRMVIFIQRGSLTRFLIHRGRTLFFWIWTLSKIALRFSNLLYHFGKTEKRFSGSFFTMYIFEVRPQKSFIDSLLFMKLGGFRKSQILRGTRIDFNAKQKLHLQKSPFSCWVFFLLYLLTRSAEL